MKLKIIIFLLCLISVAAKASGTCWSKNEISDHEFAEMDGMIVLSFKDAVDCKPLQNASVHLQKREYKTGMNGSLRLPQVMFDSISDDDLPITVSKKGYITLKTHLKVVVGGVWNKHFLLTEKIPINQMRFVLQWGEEPHDLDLHLLGKNFHISYRNKKNVGSMARLDRDSRRGYGPETITLEKVEDGQKYQLFVHQYSSQGKFDAHSQVHVYKNSQLDRVVVLPDTEQRRVHILDIVNHKVQYFNRPTSEIK